MLYTTLGGGHLGGAGNCLGSRSFLHEKCADRESVQYLRYYACSAETAFRVHLDLRFCDLLLRVLPGKIFDSLQVPGTGSADIRFFAYRHCGHCTEVLQVLFGLCKQIVVTAVTYCVYWTPLQTIGCIVQIVQISEC